MGCHESTREKILTTALALILNQGITKTGLAEVAHKAGVTRVTVYRYFEDKATLMNLALMVIPQVLEKAEERFEEGETRDIEALLDGLFDAISSLPKGDYPLLFGEVKKAYPQTWVEFRRRWEEAISAIFRHLFAIAAAEGRLRDGLNREVMLAYFNGSIATLLEMTDVLSRQVPADELFSTMKNVFLFGILES